MFEWKIEDMVLMNTVSKSLNGRFKEYPCENTTSREDKIKFVDKSTDGLLSYIIELKKKFDNDAVDMPKDRYGDVKTISLKAWCKRNDERKVIDVSFRYGEYYILGVKRYISRDINISGNYDKYSNLVDEVFYRLLVKLEQEERNYFSQHDEYSVLKKLLDDMISKYHTTFGVCISRWSSSGKTVIRDKENNMEREITIDEIKELLGKYEKIENLINQLTAETNIVY